MSEIAKTKQNNTPYGKKSVYAIGGIIILLGSFWIYSTPKNQIGTSDSPKKLPIDFLAYDLSGKEFKGSTLLGKTVLLDFWAVWCAPCIAAFPELNKLEEDLKESNFEIAGIALYSGNRDDVMKIIEQHPVNYRILMGDNNVMPRRYGVIGFPTYHLITPEGTIFKKYVGELPDLFDRIRNDVEKINERYKHVAVIEEL